jgi:hypothetical protein
VLENLRGEHLLGIVGSFRMRRIRARFRWMAKPMPKRSRSRND